MKPQRLSRRKRRWRLVRRAAGALGALGVLAGGFCWYGWRYGLTPLPEPVPGVALESPPKVSCSELGPTNFWYWARVLESALPRADTDEDQSPASQERAVPSLPNSAPPSGDKVQSWFVSSLVEWSRYGPVVLTNREELVRWVAEHPVVEECYRNATSNLHGLDLELDAVTEQRLARPGLLLALYPLWLAQQAELEGRRFEALEYLLAAWRTSAQANLQHRWDFTACGSLANCWRRLVLTGPPLPSDEARRLLDSLAGARNLLPSLEVAYVQYACRDAEPSRCSCDGQALQPLEWDWADIWRDFGRAFEEIGEELVEWFQYMAGLGARSRPDDGRGIWRLAEPVETLLGVFMRAAARPEDCQRLKAAYFSQVVARLRLGKLQAAEDYAMSLLTRDHNHKLRAFLDRPMVWFSAWDYPLPSQALRDVTRWRCGLETCRLTLALRVYKDRHGVWPERLEDVVPEVLPAVPIEPCSGSRFLYRKHGDTWQVLPRAGHHDYRDAAPNYRMEERYDLRLRAFTLAPGEPVRVPLCSSEEAKEAPVQWERRLRAEAAKPTGPMMMDLRMFQRYGLIPKGFKFVPEKTVETDSAPAQTTNGPAATNRVTGLSPASRE